MKEFIEKLINRLEKEKIIAFKTYRAFDMNTDLGRMFGIEKSIEITNELAERYNNDFCEWHNGTSSIFPIKTSCGNSIDVNYVYEFCTYCGKKIKIAPY